VFGLMLIDTRPERPQPRRRRKRPNVHWRLVAGLTAAGGLGVGSSAVSGPVGYGMLLGAFIAAGLGLGGGHDIPMSGLRDHRQ
jgi:hypothetical protein